MCCRRVLQVHAWLLLALAACSGSSGSKDSEDATFFNRSGSVAGAGGAGAAPADSPQSAIQLLAMLRARHVIKDEDSSTSTSAIPQSDSDIQRSGNEWQVQAAPGDAPASVAAASVSSNGPLRVATADGRVVLKAALRGAGNVQGQAVEGYVVYRSAGPGASTLLQRLQPDAVEDYLSLDSAPPNNEVIYDLDISGAVGLRLVSNVLELVDAGGDPQIRIAPPLLVSADGHLVAANFGMVGCSVDRSPAPPWGRAVVPLAAAQCELHIHWNAADVRYPALLDPNWSGTSSMIDPRARHTASALASGLVLVAGGVRAGPGGEVLASAELYNPATHRWAATGAMSDPRMLHMATRLGNGLVLVNGGAATSDAASSLASAELYDEATGLFTPTSPMSTPRMQASATLLPSGAVLVAGGMNGSAMLASCELYGSASNSWSPTGALLAPQTLHTAVYLPSNSLVLLVGTNSPSAQLYRYSTGIWSAAGAPAVPRSAATLTVLANNQVLYAGGLTPDGSSVATAEIYNPILKSWTRTGSLGIARAWHAAARLSDGRVLVAGGQQGASATADAELYDPTWGTWAPLPNMSAPRTQHTSTPLSNGNVLMAGGADASATPAEEFVGLRAPTVTTEYHLPAAVDPDVLPDRATELWASVHRPKSLDPAHRYPLIVMLHGMHATCGTGFNPRVDDNCQYTDTGTCPAGYQVVANHLGLAYLADELAARDFIVVSINTDRGINCGATLSDDPMLDLARGRAVLKHLQMLSAWNRGSAPTPASVGVSLAGQLDFDQVGLLGHSRGGEGVRAAYQLYRDPDSMWSSDDRIGPLTVRAIFEIAPVDGGTPRDLNADGVPWNVILPMCDVDVPMLEGVRVFDRMMNASGSELNPSPKSTYLVWGANHNYYNTEWQQSDSPGCYGHRALFAATGATGSAEQRQTALYSAVSFFTAYMGAAPAPALAHIFDPHYPTVADPRVDRGYSPAWQNEYNETLEDFSAPTGTSSYGQPNSASNITISHGSIPGHELLRGASIGWTVAGPSTFFESHFAAPGSGIDLSRYSSIDLRLARQLYLNPAAPTDFYVSLLNADGTSSSQVRIGDYITLDGPVGSANARGTPRYHPILQTARIPISAWSGVSPAAVRGIRLEFSSSSPGYINVADIRATRDVGSAGAPPPAARASPPASGGGTGAGAGQITSADDAREVYGGTLQRKAASAGVEFWFSSDAPFLPRDAPLTLDVGGHVLRVLRHPGGDLHRVVFSATRAQWDELADGAALQLYYGVAAANSKTVSWEFGTLDKGRLQDAGTPADQTPGVEQ